MPNVEIKDGSVEAVNWTALFPSLKLAKAGVEALQPWRMAAGAVWVALLAGGAAALDAATGGGMEAFLHDEAQTVARLRGAWNPLEGGVELGRLLLVRPYEFIMDKPGAAIPALAWCLLWTLIAGAWISRLAACRVALGRGAGARDVLAFLRARLLSILGAPALVLGALGAAYGLLMLAGLACFSVPALVGVGAVLFGVLLPVGALVVLLAVAWVLGAGLMVPAVAVDGNDGFDAPGRAVSYLLTRPWAIALHAAVLAMLAVVFVGIAVMFKEFALQVTASAVHHGAVGDGFKDAWSGHGEAEFAAKALAVWRDLARLLVTAYGFSFTFTGLTRIYFLIRESADGVPETDLWQPTEDKPTVPRADA